LRNINNNRYSLIFLRIFYFIIFYSLIYVPLDVNVDVDSYRQHYDESMLHWEVGYNFLASLAKAFNLSYEYFYIYYIAIESALLSIFFSRFRIYSSYYVIPAISLIAISVLGTQIRFGLSIILFSFYFYSVSNWKIRLLALFSAVMMHNSSIALVLILIFCNIVDKITFNKKNIIIAISLAIIIYLYSFDIILIFLNYFNYQYSLDSDFLSARSLPSLIYNSTTIGLLLFNFKKLDGSNTLIFKFYLTLLISSLIFSSFAIISGRLLLVSFLIQPIYLCYKYWNKSVISYSDLAIILITYALIFFM
jgi:hypothetical protein